MSSPRPDAADQPVALVTGTRKGIGRHLAERLVAVGYRVIGCSREPADWELEGYEHVLADVSIEEDVKRLLSLVQKKYGRLDVAVNNAGIASMNHALLIPASTLDRVFAVNVRGTFLICREAAKLMRRRSFGRIVNMTTIAAPLALEGESIYAASKAAVESLTRILSRELAAFGITVNAVGPSPIDTDLIRGVPKDRMQKLIDRLPIARRGTCADVSNVIEFFIKPESDYLTGQVIYLGGVN
ncbi:MAG: SDR family oxidoreductase [Chthoniobacteraceae bacterium]